MWDGKTIADSRRRQGLALNKRIGEGLFFQSLRQAKNFYKSPQYIFRLFPNDVVKNITPPQQLSDSTQPGHCIFPPIHML